MLTLSCWTLQVGPGHGQLQSLSLGQLSTFRRPSNVPTMRAWDVYIRLGLRSMRTVWSWHRLRAGIKNLRPLPTRFVCAWWREILPTVPPRNLQRGRRASELHSMYCQLLLRRRLHTVSRMRNGGQEAVNCPDRRWYCRLRPGRDERHSERLLGGPRAHR